MNSQCDTPQNDNSTKVVIGILVGAGVVLLLCCGVGAGTYFWLRDTVGDFGAAIKTGIDEGLDDFDRQVQADVHDHPVILERIGTISEFKNDFDLSLEEDGEDVWVFRIQGEKGSGVLRAVCVTIDENHEDVVSAELKLESGETIQLYPDKPLQ